MEIPIIAPANGETPALAPPSRVDLNTADASALNSIPGVDSALAERILAYREERGPFLAVEELLAVPGVDGEAFAGIAEHVMVSFPPLDSVAGAPEQVEPDSAPLSLAEDWLPPDEVAPALEEPVPPAPPAVPVPSLAAEAHLPEPPPAVLTAAPEPALSTPQPVSVAPPPEPPPAAPHPVSRPEAPASAPTREPRAAKGSGWGWLAWVGAVFAGSILGMIFSLLVLNGINGTLNMDYHPAIVDLRNQTTDLGARQETLQGEVNGLRQRLDRLEGLTARMDQAEAAVKELRGEVETLDEETATLQTAVETLTQQIADVEARTAKAETFFQRLQALLSELFGGAEPMPEVPIEQEVQP
ncbi:MAG: ComE operon protein 1 [Chloroflexi bacterium ADurb.Bin360]|nr:MAG: ComE operon protein 1 [Chloroflexi bacterium ADurb.Bin360]